jgi:transposase
MKGTAMSMGHGSGRKIPAEPVRAAEASNPNGTPAMWMRDRLQELFTEADFADWFPANGRRGLAPAMLALVSVLQYAENLTDRQAAQALRCRIAWKYCLGLELTDPGFDHTVLSEFRDRLAVEDRADRLLTVLMDRLAAAGLVRRHGRIRTDPRPRAPPWCIDSTARSWSQTLRAALEELANTAEDGLAALVTPGWVQRYGRPVRYDRLPRGTDELACSLRQVGQDGMRLLHAVYAPDAAPRLRHSKVEVLRQVWVQPYWSAPDGQLAWRGPKS